MKHDDAIFFFLFLNPLTFVVVSFLLLLLFLFLFQFFSSNDEGSGGLEETLNKIFKNGNV